MGYHSDLDLAAHQVLVEIRRLAVVVNYPALMIAAALVLFVATVLEWLFR